MSFSQICRCFFLVSKNGEEFEERGFANGIQDMVLSEEHKDKIHPVEKTDSVSSSQDIEDGKTRKSDSISSIGADSSASEFDMEEFDASLKALQSLSRKKDPNKNTEGGDMIIRHLDFVDSDIEDDLSETPLSVIQEEDEESITGGESQRAAGNRSGSFSEGFRSDDDVMDLLDDEPDSGEFVPALYKPTMITEFPKSDKDLAQIEPLSHVDRRTNSLSEYLPSPSNPKELDISSNPNNQPDEEMQLEKRSHEDADQIATFSEAEVDHDNLQNAYLTSTPLSGSPRYQHGNDSDAELSGDNIEQPRDVQDVPSTQTDDVSVELKVEPNISVADKTYTIEDRERTTTAVEEEVKIFIALYDYDPRTMSPNADAEEEELAFREGDLIKVRESLREKFLKKCFFITFDDKILR